MSGRWQQDRATVVIFCGAHVILSTCPVVAQLSLGGEQIVQAGGADINVAGYSVPSYVDWDNDGRLDLITGEGPTTASQGKVRVYLNIGTSSQPQFSTFFYAQSMGSDLAVAGGG